MFYTDKAQSSFQRKIVISPLKSIDKKIEQIKTGFPLKTIITKKHSLKQNAKKIQEKIEET